MMIEAEILTRNPDELRRSATSMTQALAVCVIRQAFVDALWTEHRPGGHQRERDLRQRLNYRVEDIEFLVGHIDPASDVDLGWGDDDELLTLNLWCEIGDLDEVAIRKLAITKIFERSPAHRKILARFV